MENYSNYGFGLWGVVLRECNFLIGDCGLTMQNINGSLEPEIGYHINRKYTGKGYATEAARACRNYAFDILKLPKLYSYMKYTNIASAKVAEKNGMKLVNELKDEKNGITKVYAITIEEYKSMVYFEAPYTNNGHWTYADYKAWELKPRERYEIIHGYAYAMSAPNAFHQAMLTEMVRQFANFLTGKPCRVYPAPYDVRLFYEEDESDDTVVQPDISVVCDPKKRGREGCRGAPDLVVEILSPSNTAIEMQRKFEAYRDAGVAEYWVLNSEHKKLTVYLFEGEKFVSRTYGEKDAAPVSVLQGLTVELASVFAEASI